MMEPSAGISNQSRLLEAPTKLLSPAAAHHHGNYDTADQMIPMKETRDAYLRITRRVEFRILPTHTIERRGKIKRCVSRCRNVFVLRAAGAVCDGCCLHRPRQTESHVWAPGFVPSLANYIYLFSLAKHRPHKTNAHSDRRLCGPCSMERQYHTVACTS